LRDVVNERLADQIFCEFDCIDGQIAEAETADARGSSSV
jgi:hypothetical protein